MSKNKTLSWNDRFALIDHYQPSDEQACNAFGVSHEELNTARDMRSSGAFTPSENLDVNAYGNLFNASAKAASKSTRRSGATSTAKATQKSSGTSKPSTATKKTTAPKKRGRKGDKIAKAFAEIPANPTPVEQFASNHGVSIAVLRQSKRFDKSPEKGAVRVKKDKGSNQLMIWREASSS